MARYTYQTQDLVTGEPIADLPLSCSSLPRAISSDASTTFTLDIADPRVRALDPATATAPGRVALFALRDDVPVWGGIVWGRSYQAATTSITINASTVESYWRHRFWTIARTYTNIDQFALVYSMLHGARTGSGNTNWIRTDGSGYLGTSGTAGQEFDYDGTPVTVNAEPAGLVLTGYTFDDVAGTSSLSPLSGVLRSLTYQPGKNVYDALLELAALPNGFEWTFDPARLADGSLGWQLRIGSPRIGRTDDVTDLLFEYRQGLYDPTTGTYRPGLGSNIRDYTFTQDATASANRSIVTGQEESGNVPVTVTGYLSSLRAGFPLLEIGPSYSDASADQVAAKSLGDLAAAPLPDELSTWTVRADGDMGFGTAQIGDEAVFAVSDLLTPVQASGYDGRYSVERVVGWSLTPEQRGQQEAWQLTTNPTTQASPRLPRSEQRRLDRIERSLSSVAKTSRVAQSKTYGWVASMAQVTIPVGTPGAWTNVTDISFVRQGDWLTLYNYQAGNGTGTATIDWRLVNDDGSIINQTHGYNATGATRAFNWWIQFSLDAYNFGDIVVATLQSRVTRFTGSISGGTVGANYLVTGLPYHN